MSAALTKLRRARWEHPFLPVSLADVRARGWERARHPHRHRATPTSIIPAFGPLLIARFLEGRGFKVGLIAQPDWRSADDIRALGRAAPLRRRHRRQPRLDAQQAHRAEEDPRRGPVLARRRARHAARPRDHRLREPLRARRSPDVPIVLGGIEASLRRIAHYDYWSRHGAPLDPARRQGRPARLRHGRAPGVGDRAPAAAPARPIEQLRDVRGTAVPLSKRRGGGARRAAVGARRPTGASSSCRRTRRCAPTRTRSRGCRASCSTRPTRTTRARSCSRTATRRRLLQPAGAAARDRGDGRALRSAVRPRAAPDVRRGVGPAFETVKHSIVTMRGCFGGCTFCSITEHEGRIIQSRSADSVLREVRALRRMDDFRGVITDLGGPTANMYKMRCKDERSRRVPPPLVRAPRHLREPRDRSRPAHRPHARGAQGAGRQARLRRLGRALRPRRDARPRVHRRARRAITRRAALGRARAHPDDVLDR